MHWKHSRFEIVNIILGNCHTFDEAYRVLCELEEDRDFSISSSLAESLRAQAKVVTAKSMLADKSETKSQKLQAECNIEEQKARKIIAQPCLDEARRELDFIRMLKSIIDPHRVYKDYPDHVAHQLAQEREWRYELHWKSYNYICATGTVPHDHLMLLRMHPQSDQLLHGLRTLTQDASSPDFLFKSKRDILNMVHRFDTSGILVIQDLEPDRLISDHVLSEPQASLTYQEFNDAL